MRRLQYLATASIAVGLLVLALKYAAYHVTGSVALYSDALESIINVLTAVLALSAIRIGAKPADSDHPYGHHKAEYFSAVLSATMIIIAALLILREAYLHIQQPEPLRTPGPGLALSAAATLVNAGWAFLLFRAGRDLVSPALSADARHLLADVVTSLGVIIGIGLVAVTGWAVLDPALAALVGVNIVWSGWRLLKESVGGLMDRAAAPATVDRIKAIISGRASKALEAHDLRTRSAGRRTFIDFHLVVPGDMRVSEAHDICDELEQALRAEVDDALITIHVEPEEKAKHSGIVVL